MPLLTLDDHAAIRAAIDARLTPRDLPDELIAQEIYRGAAKREIVRRDPLAETRVDAEGASVRRAAILYCAAQLCPVAPLYSNETVGKWSGSRAGVDPVRRRTELLHAYEAELGLVLGTGALIPVFPLLIAGRGRWDR